MKELLIRYLVEKLDCKVEKVGDDQLLVTTDLLRVQEVLTELYTSGYSNFVVTVVDSRKVCIRTEEVA